jgi:hypothetical protein
MVCRSKETSQLHRFRALTEANNLQPRPEKLLRHKPPAPSPYPGPKEKEHLWLKLMKPLGQRAFLVPSPYPGRGLGRGFTSRTSTRVRPLSRHNLVNLPAEIVFASISASRQQFFDRNACGRKRNAYHPQPRTSPSPSPNPKAKIIFVVQVRNSLAERHFLIPSPYPRRGLGRGSTPRALTRSSPLGHSHFVTVGHKIIFASGLTKIRRGYRKGLSGDKFPLRKMAASP